MRILCIHGIGNPESKADWRNDWAASLTHAVGEWQSDAPVIQQFAYDDVFGQADHSSKVYVKATMDLLKSWGGHLGERGLFGLPDWVRWHIGMVAQFAALPDLREAVAQQLAAQIRSFQPDVLVAHSLGGLVTYQCLGSKTTQNKLGGFQGSLVTLGTQISHPALRDVFGGYLQCPPMLKRWWNLFNENDTVLTQPIVLPNAARYRQIPCDFRFGGINHDADHYLAHDNARSACWRELVHGLAQPAAPAAITKGKSKSVGKGVAAVAEPLALAPERPKLRALLVGIADYADPSFALQGPVNDVFLVSQTLQEMGVEADAIRVVLNERATADAIRERLTWLLADAQADDTMFFYFSGHGAQVPAYGQDAEVDHIDECLVPYDFHWQTGNAIFDDEFAELYSQLPYSAKFVAMLDCCHAGGMQRGGVPGAGGPQSGIRTIAMPDDIRHRALRWDRASQMWLPREALLGQGKKRIKALMAQETGKSKDKAKSQAKGQPDAQAKVKALVGQDGTRRRIGRAQALRGDNPAAYEALRAQFGHQGPYMPILLEACAEEQSAYEYRHGSVHYGAFTYALCESLGRGRGHERKQSPTFEQLLAATQERVNLVASGPQTPQLVCASAHRGSRVIG